MEGKGDGGPAFPDMTTTSGMSLRDWFAGQALVGQIAWEGAEGCGADRGARGVASWCYELADAMLAERKRPVKEAGNAPPA